MKEEMDFDSGYGLERLKTYAEFKYEIYKLLEQNRKLENNWKELKNKVIALFNESQEIFYLDILQIMQEIESGKNEDNS